MLWWQQFLAIYIQEQFGEEKAAENSKKPEKIKNEKKPAQNYVAFFETLNKL